MKNFLVTYKNAFGSSVARWFSTEEEVVTYIQYVSNSARQAFEIFDYTKKV